MRPWAHRPLRATAAAFPVLPILGLAVAYALAVRLAWALPVRSGLVAVWPAAGIALGALVRWGRNLWPGVLLGAFSAAGSPRPSRCWSASR
jgi:integral membrane sensor domain MASE1